VRKIILVFSFFVFFVFFCFFLFFYLKNEEINCVGNVVFINGKNKLSLVIKHKMSDGNGIITQSGTLDLENQNPVAVSQIIRFQYSKNNDVFIAKSTSIQNSPRNMITSEEEKHWLPEFFVKEGSELTWIIKQSSINSWFFFSNPVPLYICERLYSK
jgi:hypothetical protein